MRDGGLSERLDRAATAPLLRLDDVARALREVTERTATTIGNDEQEPVTAHALAASGTFDHLSEADHTDQDPELPQILQYPSTSYSADESEPAIRAHGQAVAPLILALSTVVVGVLMTASFADLSRVPGLSWLTEKQRPRLSAAVPQPIVQPLVLQASFDSEAAPDNTVKEPRNPETGPALSLDELALLERCESLIAAGDIQGARRELAVAASAGSVNARFALAETFDPNVLAAWGLRDRVADAGTARVLYEQAFDAGDRRAETRLSALRDLP